MRVSQDILTIETAVGTLRLTETPLDPKRKCLVKFCPNRAHEGRFEGSVCVPCATTLRGEERSPTWALQRIVRSVGGQV